VDKARARLEQTLQIGRGIKDPRIIQIFDQALDELRGHGGN
jgi:hypothetical protein